MVVINITDAGPGGAQSYHVKSYRLDFVFNPEAGTLIIPLDSNNTLHFVWVSLKSLEHGKISLIGVLKTEKGLSQDPALCKIEIEMS